MILTESYDDRWFTGLTHRRVSACGRVELGVYKVLYGFRVRSGFVGAQMCELDWCAGSDWVDVQTLYSIALGILVHRDVTVDCFEGMPRAPQLKPYYRDAEFVCRLRELLPVVEAVVLVAPVVEREEVW